MKKLVLALCALPLLLASCTKEEVKPQKKAVVNQTETVAPILEVDPPE